MAIAVVVIDSELPSLEEDQRVDWFGAFLISAGLVFVVFVLTQGEVAEPDQWKTPCASLPRIGLLSALTKFRHHRSSHCRRLPHRCVCIPAAPPREGQRRCQPTSFDMDTTPTHARLVMDKSEQSTRCGHGCRLPELVHLPVLVLLEPALIPGLRASYAHPHRRPFHPHVHHGHLSSTLR